MKNNLIVRYTYDFMPKGLLPRFIVRMHRYIKNPALSWRSGAVLERQGTQALVAEKTYGSREIIIKVKGFERKELMTLITEDFDDMHGKFDNLKVKKLIPCNCAKCKDLDEPHFYEYDNLIRRKEKGKQTVECEKSYDDVEVTGLLDGVFTNISKATEAAACKENALRVFLSYSHKDEAYKEELDKHLSALKESNRIKVWNDGMISGGAEWDETIKSELKAADIILLLISPDFMASKYIKEVEMKAAIERHERKEVKVIPIFLRKCDFKGMSFDKLQGYPKDAKTIKSFEDTDEAFYEIAQGIRKDIDEWKK